MTTKHLSILKNLLSLPTAPFVEQYVIDFVERFCAARPVLRCEADRHGNLLVSYRHGRGAVRRPITLTAHLDHPGFVAEKMLRAAWRGGVKAEYFPKQRVRFFSEGAWIRGRIAKLRLARTKPTRWGPRIESVDVAVSRAVEPGSAGMWDLPDPRIRGRRLHARACDDLAGAAAMLCALDALCRRRKSGRLDCLFTRAEEVGFVGAIAACRSKTLARSARVVSVECSSELPGATIGAGPILRVGDLARVFSPELTAQCRAAGDALARRDRAFRYQRKLMDGGTCEATAFCEYGYEAAGICLPLGNYHNMNRRTGKIAPEYVGLDDLAMLVKWFVALAASPTAAGSTRSRLRRRIDANYKEFRSLLT